MAGYASMPTANLSSIYGAVIHYQYFGQNGATSPYNDGGTTTHEVGHCLNLWHTWGDDGGTCTGSDSCGDTPPQGNWNFNCHTGVITDNCSPNPPGIMYMNFMDYTDDACYANFTPDQKNRMQALFSINDWLNQLANSDACTVGIEESSSIYDVNIFPNPSQDKVNIVFNLANTDDVIITLSNIMGELIARSEKQKVSSVNDVFDLSKQSPGIYFVKVQSAKQSIVRKISLVR